LSDPGRSVGVVDPGGDTASRLSSRLRAAGHESFRLLADPEWRPHWSDRLVASWTGRIDALPRPPALLVGVTERGGGPALAEAARRFPTATLVAGTSPAVDLGDQLETLLVLADADLEVARVLGGADRPVELPAFLATDGPVVLRNRRGADVAAARVCHGTDQLAAVVGGLGPAAAVGGWYLQEYLAGDDVVVAGVFRSGEPCCWAAVATHPNRPASPRVLDEDDAARILELAADAAEVLRLEGPCRLELRRHGTDARLVAVTAGVSPELVALGAAGPDDEVVRALVDPGASAAGPRLLDGRRGDAVPGAYRWRARLGRRG